MPDTPPLTLANQALARLRKYAEGNGVDPDSIQVVDSKEDLYSIQAQIRLVPEFNIQPNPYAGAVRGKGRRVLGSYAELQEIVARMKQTFLDSKDWMPEAIKDLQESPGHGWGMEDAVIPLSNPKETLAATENCPSCNGGGKLICPQCQGQTTVICSYCFGKGQENCYHCFGRGEDPVNPQQPCPICRGTRFAPCRYCQSRGQLPCPTCQGHGGTPCSDCHSTGLITQEIAISAHAKVEFHILGNQDLPSGLLRSLDRLGIVNLVKGHGDIELTLPDAKAPDAEKTTLQLQAKMPYADIKMRLMDKLVMVASFGKRGLLSGLPAFLDVSLRPWREHLERAALGEESLEKALEARALREALMLALDGKDKPNDLRRLYTIGLSQNAAQEIMRNIGLTLRHITLQERGIAAALCFVLCVSLFAGLFFTPLFASLAASMSPKMLLLIEALVPVAAVGLSWTVISHATRWVLQRKYPNANVRLTQKIGKIGYGALAGIVAAYGLIFAIVRGKLGG